MKLDLTGKVALVTGGSRGIGRACSLLLALCGARVVVNYQKSREKAEDLLREIAQGGGEAHLFQADVANPEQIEVLFRYIRETFGRLDILVNNAGLIKDNLLLTMDLSDWRKSTMSV